MAQNADSVLTFCRSYAFTFLLLCYLLYMIIGAVIFMVLEQPEQNSLVAEVHELRVRFLENNQCVKESSLDRLLKKVLFAGKRGVTLKADSDEYNFDFTSSLFFVITFLTTTGYGTTVPLSDEGRVFCMLYCVFGIPLTFLLLSCITHALVPRLSHAPIRHLQIYWGLSRNKAALIYCGILAASTATLFFLLPAVSLCLLEKDWSFLESFYFCFISLSTIGLGDYLPGQTHSWAARQALEFATSCYLVLGLVVLLVVMESFWKLQQVQALVRLFVGSTAASLKEDDLDEQALSEWPDSHDIPTADVQFKPPISIISHRISDLPPTPSVEDACTPFTPQVASYKKTVRPPHQPDTDPDPADQNN
ncbi:potassium channel, subfamily K, member 7 [Pangasianodon hypophthalmus]|uniref:potassium channel, subfamily K, member 7 n=1 Tax=Pangasianodon hypophthalmus TaxID=310915 RepID=UPI002307C060|nr:potassium channel, subfamily K, member 7 [Pangasianodon hypophthalmus]